MARVAYCLVGTLSLALSLLAFTSDVLAAPAAGAGVRGFHGARVHGRATVPWVSRGHRAYGLHRSRFGDFRGGRYRRAIALYGGAEWPGFYGSTLGQELVPPIDGIPAYAGPPFAGSPVSGIPSAPPAAPALYVIEAAGSSRAARARKGFDPHPGPKILSRPSRSSGQDDAGLTEPVGGARIIHVRVPRGL